MQLVIRSTNPRLTRVFLSLLAVAVATGAQAASLDFDRTFNAKGEPRQLHYQASYMLNGQAHTTESWRDGERHLKRRTDDRIETHVFKPERAPEWRMVVLDLQRKIRTDIDRTNLLRIGHFTDWFSLAHALARPVGTYQLLLLSDTASMPKSVASCRWYGLTRSDVESRICWSNTLRLPLLITDNERHVQWQVTAVNTRTLPATAFGIDDAGFVHNNANDEIQSD